MKYFVKPFALQTFRPGELNISKKFIIDGWVSETKVRSCTKILHDVPAPMARAVVSAHTMTEH